MPSLEKLSSSRHPTKKCSSSWVWNGFYPICFFRASKSLHVSSTALNRELITLIELRYRFFCTKKGNIDSTQLPRCVDCLFKHASRANFQAAIWKQSLQSCQGTPTPIGSGWREGGDHFAIDWMSGDPAPTAVLELLSCSCTRSCQLPTCSCLANGLKCTDVCKLLDCDNRCEDSTEELVSDNRDEEEQIQLSLAM